MTITMRHITAARGTPFGGEQLRLEEIEDIAYDADAKHDVMYTLAASAADGNVVAWSSTASPVAVPAFVGIFVDPDAIAGATLNTIAVELTYGATVVVVQVRRGVPFQLGDPSGSADITDPSSNLTQIRIRNDGAQAATVRIVALQSESA